MKIWQKLAAMAVILTIPAAYVTWLLTVEKNINIDFARSEIAGIRYTQPLYDLLVNVGEHRGMSVALLSGDDAFKGSIVDIESKINGGMPAMTEMESKYGEQLKTSQYWGAVRDGWGNLRTQYSSLSAPESYARHTELMGKILALVNQVSDKSNLILDPERPSYYTMDVVMVRSPILINLLGQLRGKAYMTVLKKSLDDNTRFAIAALITSIKEQMDLIRTDIGIATENNATLKPLTAPLDDYISRVNKFTEMVEKEVIGSGGGEMITVSAKEIFSVGTDAVEANKGFGDHVEDELVRLLDERSGKLGWDKYLMFLQIVICLGIVIFIAYFVTRSITSPIGLALNVASTIASGRLDSVIETRTTDEIGQMLASLRSMQDKLTEVIQGIRVGVEEVASASGQVAQGNENLSQRTQEQASSLEEVASSMEEMAGTVSQNADNAQQANQLAMASREQADKGGAVVGRAVSAMEEINQSSKKIADIIGVIDEIAFQTNLLALNAAVEAARAGEQGRGFAVVASEVRNLAGRSATAAKEIKSLIQDSVAKVEEGSRLVNESGKTLEEIMVSVKKVTDIVAEIASATQEQSSGIAQVNKAVLQMDEMTQQNASLVEEAAAAAESMGAQAQQLNTLVDYFKVGSDAGGARQRTGKPAEKTVQLVSAPAQSRPPGRIEQTRQALQKAIAQDDSEWAEF